MAKDADPELIFHQMMTGELLPKPAASATVVTVRLRLPAGLPRWMRRLLARIARRWVRVSVTQTTQLLEPSCPCTASTLAVRLAVHNAATTPGRN